MSRPVLVVRGSDADHALGFAPHRAFRDLLHSEHHRRMGSFTADEMLPAETEGLAVGFHAGKIDPSGLPSSYKKAEKMVGPNRQIRPGAIEDYVDPFGCIMIGDMRPRWMNKSHKKRR